MIGIALLALVAAEKAPPSWLFTICLIAQNYFHLQSLFR